MNSTLSPPRGQPRSENSAQSHDPRPKGSSSLVAEPTEQMAGLIFLFLVGCLAALALGMPALAVAVAPLGIWLLWGLAAQRHGSCDVTLLLDRDRAVEGETVEATILVKAATSFQRVLCSVTLPAGLVADPTPSRVAVSPGPDGSGLATLSIRCERWGVHQIGPGAVLARNALGVFQARGKTLNAVELRVYPSAPKLRSGVKPAMTQVFVGEERARERAEGFEFADIRKFQPGDLTRRINWRVTARQGEPYVSLQHPERNADIILLLDTLADFQLGSDGTLAWEGRAVAALAQLHLARRDRVGLLSYGGVLHALPPGAGSNHLYRILDTVIDTKVVTSYTRPTMALLPPRTLPPHALVIAFTPLADPRMTSALLDLHGRGCDLAVVEVDPERYLAREHDRSEAMSWRIWRLTRSAQRQELRRSGVPLIRWDPSEPLDSALVQLNQMRRGQWHARV
jgi:uncharacterized protein (DUF58 family)